MILEGKEVTKLLKVLNVHLQYIWIFGNQQLLSDKLIGKCNIWSEEVLLAQGVYYSRAEFFKSSTKLDVSVGEHTDGPIIAHYLDSTS